MLDIAWDLRPFDRHDNDFSEFFSHLGEIYFICRADSPVCFIRFSVLRLFLFFVDSHNQIFLLIYIAIWLNFYQQNKRTKTKKLLIKLRKKAVSYLPIPRHTLENCCVLCVRWRIVGNPVAPTHNSNCESRSHKALTTETYESYRSQRDGHILIFMVANAILNSFVAHLPHTIYILYPSGFVILSNSFQIVFKSAKKGQCLSSSIPWKSEKTSKYSEWLTRYPGDKTFCTQRCVQWFMSGGSRLPTALNSHQWPPNERKHGTDKMVRRNIAKKVHKNKHWYT